MKTKSDLVTSFALAAAVTAPAGDIKDPLDNLSPRPEHSSCAPPPYPPQSAWYLVQQAPRPELATYPDFLAALRKFSADTIREDGSWHPVDFLLTDLKKQRTKKEALDWLQRAQLDLQAYPGPLSDLLRGLTVQPENLHEQAWLIFAISGLSHPSVLVRDSATRMLEAWEATSLAAHLRSIAEREKVAWLADYMRGVAEDLQARG